MSNESEWTCPSCPSKKFSSKHSLRKHLRVVHDPSKEKCMKCERMTKDLKAHNDSVCEAVF